MSDKIPKLRKSLQNRIVGNGVERVDQLLANPGNWRLHPSNQQNALAGAIDDIGFIRSITVNKVTGHVVDGHLRVTLAARSGVAELPVEYVELSEQEESKALLLLDPIAEMAQADKTKMQELLSAVNSDDERVQKALSDIAAENKLQFGDEPPDAPEPQIDKAEELRVKWGVESGQLWQLGEHRLICGDCTDKVVVERVLDIQPEIMVTDPPYGVNYNPQWRSDAAEEGHLAYAARRIGKVENDDRADWSAAWLLFPGDVVYSWHPPGATSLVHGKALQDSGFELRMQIIWAKSNFPISRGDYHVRHEPCWYAVRKGKTAQRTDDRTQTTLWQINLDKNVDGGHSTQKPLECMERPIRNHSFTIVYDPFLGSGTTLIACERLGRKCRAVEISPAYCAVAIQRWADMTGGMPVLQARTGDGG